MEQTDKFGRTRPGGSFLRQQRAGKRVKLLEKAAKARRQKRREQGRIRQANYEQNMALRGDPSLNTIARALVATVVLAKKQDRDALWPIVFRTLRRLGREGYDPAKVHARLVNARHRMLGKTA